MWFALAMIAIGGVAQTIQANKAAVYGDLVAQYDKKLQKAIADTERDVQTSDIESQDSVTQTNEAAQSDQKETEGAAERVVKL